MSNIFSNRFAQGGFAIAVIGIAFFTYQNFTGEIESTDSEMGTAELSSESSVTTTAATSEGKNAEASQDNIVDDTKTENTVNNAPNIDNINTTAEETTNIQ
jgi:hypothetical protein